MDSYTCSGEPGANEFVADQIATIVNRIQARVPDGAAIVLVGSFGRGEGGVEKTPDGFRAVNDYDVVVLGEEQSCRTRLRGLGHELAGELGVDYVDIGVIRPSALESLKPTIFNYDLKMGSRVLVDDSHLFDLIPSFEPSEMPPWEGLQLVFNRAAGLLGAVECRAGANALHARDPLYLKNQIIKALVGCGDALLIIQGRYHPMCSVRRERLDSAFAVLDDSARLQRELVEMAYREKLRPGTEVALTAPENPVPALKLLRAVFGLVASRYLERPVASPSDAVVGFLRGRRTGWRSRLLTPINPAFGVSPSDLAFASVALVAFSAPGLGRDSRSPRIQARRVLSRHRPGLLLTHGSGSWEQMRQLSVDLWERHCHG